MDNLHLSERAVKSSRQNCPVRIGKGEIEQKVIRCPFRNEE